MDLDSRDGAGTLAETDNWYPQRSGVRYSLVAAIEVIEPKSGRQIVSTTSNLSRSGCHVGTTTPFNAGTPVRVRIKYKGVMFQCEGSVAYSIASVGIGIRFDKIDTAEQIILDEWLMEASSEGLESGLTEKRLASDSGKDKTIFVVCAVILVAILATALVLLGVVR